MTLMPAKASAAIPKTRSRKDGAAIALDGNQFGRARIGGRAAEIQELAQELLHVGAALGFNLQAQVRVLGVGAADLELLDFKAAVVFDYGVEDSLHQVRIDQMAFGLNDFLLHG